MRRIKLTHLIGSLDIAGTERVLCNLLARCDRRRFDTDVITLLPAGALAPRVESLGMQLRSLNMRPGRVGLKPLRQLVDWLRVDRPDCVVTWMYHANLMGAVAAWLAGETPVVWNVRNNDLPRQASKWLTRMTCGVGGRLSRRMADRVVFVSQASRQLHVERGYAAGNSLVIPNGFDMATFKPDPLARDAIRRELGLSENSLVVGLVARFHGQKDHRNFIEAAALIHRQRPAIQFLLCGNGVDWKNATLVEWIVAARLERSVQLLGLRSDMPRVQASLDVAVSSSASEAFPSAIGEAMACGVPCTVTDVGDSALLVGATGRVVPPQDAAALSNACLELISLPAQERSRLGAQARQRIANEYDLAAVAEQHFSLWAECGRQFSAHKLEFKTPARRAA